MKMISILDHAKYVDNKKLIQQIRSIKSVIVLKYSNQKVKQLLINLFFGWYLLWNKTVIVQLKKQNIQEFDFLKKWFPKKLKLIIEFEGDVPSEMDYLIEHPYRNDFYKSVICSLRKGISQMENIFSRADLIFVLVEKFKEALIERYPNQKLDSKIKIIATGVDCKKNYFSEKLRIKTRKHLKLDNKFTMTYIGNVYYSWQNISRTIEIFSLIKKKINRNVYLILLICEKDHKIAQEFIDKHNLSKEDYLLKAVPSEEILPYLNAADMGFLLRDDHPMNWHSSPGKFGEYVACGLPVLMTKNISDFSDMVSKTDYCLVLNDMYDDDEILNRIKPFFNYDKNRRNELGQWAKENVSGESKAHLYVSALKEVAGN